MRVAFSACLVVAGLLASPVAAEEKLELIGPMAPVPLSSGDFGSAVRGAGDVDADGVPDLIVGAPRHLGVDLAAGPGLVRVFSGADGHVLFEFHGTGKERLGTAVDGAGDVDGDGHADVIVGAPRGGPQVTGRVLVFSGSDGSVLREYTGGPSGGLFGQAVLGAGDLDGDGVPDLAVGEPGESGGCVRAYSGATGALIFEHFGPTALAGLGSALASAGDADGDGHPDVLAGAPFPGSYGVPPPGIVQLLSGLDGSIQLEIEGAPTFGTSLDGGRDINGDGVPDMVVGVPMHKFVPSGPPVAPGRIEARSGATGALLWQAAGDQDLDSFGFSVRFTDDLDRDHVADLLVGAPKAYLDSEVPVATGVATGFVRALSGTDGTGLFDLVGRASEFGTAVAFLGDLDGDGVPEMAAGAPRGNSGHGAASAMLGSVRIFDASGGRIIDFGASCVSPAHADARLHLYGSGAIGDEQLLLLWNVHEKSTLALLLLGSNAASLPVAGCTLLVAPPLIASPWAVKGPGGSTGGDNFHYASLRAVLRDVPPGTTVAAQAWIPDPTAIGGFVSTEAVQLTIP